MLKALGFYFYLELLLLCRRSQQWLYPVMFFLMFISLLPFVFTPALVQQFIPAGIWLAALLASLFGCEAIFTHDMTEGVLEQCMLNQVPFTLLIYAKLTAVWLAYVFPILIITPCIALLFQQSVMNTFILSLSLFLATPIFILIASLAAALTLGLNRGGLYLSLVILPLLMPIMVLGVTTLQQSQAGLPVHGLLAFLAGISLLAITCLPYTIASTLRIGIED